MIGLTDPQKKRIFYSQADHKGGGVGGISHLGPDRKQM